ncbi:uncharacterized protein F5147DRAFT_833733 [Suillus discolor]|uniref:C2H2-type domain-containing protein n=1 Tax=Suillus discolor TaxID=1912936 RepID=A0A9P7FGD7_9AGAM|nr:uncharacterized protein F5147DRAFT_833733 [Suillus discolor]KAG2116547.1 hypothetical protein F5147DRAFT_833733 [Suillus discolor]
MNGNNSSSSTGHAPSGLNGTFNASTQQPQVQLQGGQPPFSLQQQPQLVFNPHQPQPQPQPQPSHPPTYPSNAPALQNQNVPGPSLYALNEIAKETAGLAGKGPPGLPPMWNAGYAPPPPIPYNPQGPMYQWPGYGYHAPAPNYYGGYPGPQAHGAAPAAAPYHGAPMQAPPAPAAQVPPHQQVKVMSDAAPMPQVPSVGPVGGSSTGLKRKAVDEDDMTEGTREKRQRPQGNPDFELVPPGTDGKERWKCLKNACRSCRPMLEASVHKHVTETVSHTGSNFKYVCEACGTGFNRQDALKRHQRSQQCTRNREKTLAQANSQALGNNTFASSSGPASSSATQQSLPPSVAPPHVIQAVGNSISRAASSVAMSQQQFAIKVQGPASGSANQQSLPSHVAPPHAIQAAANSTFGATAPFAMSHQQFTLKARGPASSSHVPTWPAFSQGVPSLPKMQSNIPKPSFKPTTVQQPAVAPPLQAFQGTPNQTSTPLPSAPKPQPAQPSSGHAIPIVASDFSLSIFKQTAAPPQPPLPPSSLPPSEDVNDDDDDDDDDDSSGLFSEPSSPTPSNDAFDPSTYLFSAPPSPSLG